MSDDIPDYIAREEPGPRPRPKMPAEIAQAIVEVMSGVVRLHNSETNTHANYRFVSVDQYYELLRTLMANAGLVIFPEEVSTAFQTTGNGDKVRTWLKIRYEFTLIHAPSGQEWEHRPQKTAMVDASMGAQAFGAAQSYAEKFYLRSLFKMATGEPDGDAEAAGNIAPQVAKRPPTSRQAQGMGADHGHSPPHDDFPGDRPPPGGRKSSQQAKKDGEWDYITKGMGLQRSEEELRAWAKANEPRINKLPKAWVAEAKELYGKELIRVREADQRRVDRMDTSRGFDEQTGEVFEGDQEEPDPEARARRDREILGAMRTGADLPLREGQQDTGHLSEPFDDEIPFG
jgi:hypothetical protein